MQIIWGFLLCNKIKEGEYFPVYEGGLYGIFKANTEYILKENDYFYTDKMPSNWNGRYEIKIKEIEYNQKALYL